MYNSIVEAVLDHASLKPDCFCIADDRSHMSYGEFSNLIKFYSKYFISENIVKGDVVIVEAEQSILFIAVQLALQLIGSVSVPIEHNCVESKIISFIDRTDAAAVITCTNRLDVSIKSYLISELPLCDSSIENDVYYELPAYDDICEILFSTGTTGKEKGIQITHHNNVALAENIINGVEMLCDNVEMIPSPLNHSHGLRRVYANLYNGSAVVVLGSVMNLALFFKNIDTYSVNSIDLVPAALSIVLRFSKGKLSAYRSRIRYIQLGSAPIADVDKSKVCELLPETRIYNFYGSTESGCTCIYNFNVESGKSHCIGHPTFNTEVLILNDDRHAIESSVENPGLLAFKGGMNTPGYWRDEEETSKILQDGIVYSNDIAYVDEDGDIILIGRKNDVINVGGRKVAPDEIEDEVRKIEGVVDCAVIGIPDLLMGNVPKLFVEMASDYIFDPKMIHDFIADRLELYKVPSKIQKIDKIPRTYNGKILRRELK